MAPSSRRCGERVSATSSVSASAEKPCWPIFAAARRSTPNEWPLLRRASPRPPRSRAEAPPQPEAGPKRRLVRYGLRTGIGVSISDYYAWLSRSQSRRQLENRRVLASIRQANVAPRQR